jgi:hypothetical protein
MNEDDNKKFLQDTREIGQAELDRKKVEREVTEPEQEEEEPSHQLTVGEVMDALERLLASGEITRDTPTQTEGCDCVGDCVGVLVTEWGILFER